MNNPALKPPERSYGAFISYSHRDNKKIGRQWANWLHQMLESYEVPPELIRTPSRCGDLVPERIYPVFRDEEELSATPRLQEFIEDALRRSRILVVICSPTSVRSRYVWKEIAYFQSLGRGDSIIPLVISGKPFAPKGISAEPEARREALPALLRRVRAPDGRLTKMSQGNFLWADARLNDTGEEGFCTVQAYRDSLEQSGLRRSEIRRLSDDFEKKLDLARLRLLAGILGVEIGEITKRDKEAQFRHSRRRIRNLSIVSSILVLLSIVSILAAFRARVEGARQFEAQARTSILAREYDATLAHLAAAKDLRWPGRSPTSAQFIEARAQGALRGRVSTYRGHRSSVEWVGYVFGNPSLAQSLSSDGETHLWEALSGRGREFFVGDRGGSLGRNLEISRTIRSRSLSNDGLLGASTPADFRERSISVWSEFSGWVQVATTANSFAVVDPLERHIVAFGHEWSEDQGHRPICILYEVGDGSICQLEVPAGNTSHYAHCIGGGRFVLETRTDTGSNTSAELYLFDRHGTLCRGLGRFRCQQWGISCVATLLGDGSGMVVIERDVNSRVNSIIHLVHFDNPELDAQVDVGFVCRHPYDIVIRSSPDGRCLCVVAGSSAYLWDRASSTKFPLLGPGTAFQTAEVGTYSNSNAVKFSEDGKRLALVCGTHPGHRSVAVWSTSTGEGMRWLEGAEEVNALSFSADGENLATASAGGASVWSINTGQKLFNVSGHRDGINCVDFSPVGNLLIVGGSDRVVSTWEMKAPPIDSEASYFRWPDHLRGPHGWRPTKISEDGKIFAMQDAEEPVIWLARKPALAVRPIRTSLPSPRDFQISPTGKVLVSNLSGRSQLLDEDSKVIWDWAGSACYRKAPWALPESSAFNNKGDRLLTRFADERIAVWSESSGVEVEGKWSACSWSPNGSTIATGSFSGLVCIWDGIERDPTKWIRADEGTGFVTHLTFDRTGRKLLIRRSTGKCLIRDLVANTTICEFLIRTAPHKFEFTSDGGRFVTSDPDDCCRLWNASDGRVIFTFNPSLTSSPRKNEEGRGSEPVFLLHPRGNLLALWWKQRLGFWDLESGELITESRDLAAAYSAAWSLAISEDLRISIPDGVGGVYTIDASWAE